MQKRKMINGFIALQCISGFLLGLKYDSKETNFTTKRNTSETKSRRSTSYNRRAPRNSS